MANRALAYSSPVLDFYLLRSDIDATTDSRPRTLVEVRDGLDVTMTTAFVLQEEPINVIDGFHLVDIVTGRRQDWEVTTRFGAGRWWQCSW